MHAANTNAAAPTETRDAYGNLTLTLGNCAVTISENGAGSGVWLMLAHASRDPEIVFGVFSGKSYKSEVSARKQATKWLASRV